MRLPRSKSKTVNYGILFFGIGILIAIAPMVPVLIVAGIGTLFNCQVDESGTSPCLVHGINIGGTLSAFGELGWLLFFSVPVGLLVCAISLVVIVVGSVMWMIRRSDTKEITKDIDSPKV